MTQLMLALIMTCCLHHTECHCLLWYDQFVYTTYCESKDERGEGIEDIRLRGREAELDDIC